MRRHHDLGGEPAESISFAEHEAEPWAKLVNATFLALRSRGFLTIDEVRRFIEDLPPELYDRAYFERWAEALVALLDEKQLVSRGEIAARLDELKAEKEVAE